MKIITIMLIILVGLSQTANAVLIFDGNFKSGDTLGAGGSFGAWPSSCLNPQTSTQKTLQIVPAPGRVGKYAGLWTLYPGYGCMSTVDDNHAHVQKNTGIITGENWYGFSMRMDGSTPWPSNTWQRLGTAIMSISSTSAPCNSKTAELGMNIEGAGLILTRDPLCNTTSGQRYEPLLSSYTKDVWHDWMLDIKWATDTTGFIEIYHRIEGQSWVKIYSRTGIRTRKDTSAGSMVARFGSYRGVDATELQRFYGMNFKIGTTRSDVEYTGGTSTPTVTPTVTPTPTPAPTDMYIIYPIGGEVFTIGNSYTLKWSSLPATGNVKLELLKNNIITTTLSSSTANDGSWVWNTDINSTNIGTDYKIRVTHLTTGKTATSSNIFTIKSPSNIPTCGFAATTISTKTIEFKDTSTNNPTRHDWIYGDGKSLIYTTSGTVTHQYENNGTYVAKHLSSNSYGVSNECSKIITIGISSVPTPIPTIPPTNNYFNLKFIDEIIDYITKLIFSIF